MPTERLLALLEDQHTLHLAYAASSAYVMRRAFESIKELQAFRGRADLAPSILERLAALVREPKDPVVIAAHLYALELTGSRGETGKGALAALRALRKDPMVSQFAGHTAAGLVRERLAPGVFLKKEELEEIVRAVEKEVGQK